MPAAIVPDGGMAVLIASALLGIMICITVVIVLPSCILILCNLLKKLVLTLLPTRSKTSIHRQTPHKGVGTTTLKTDPLKRFGDAMDVFSALGFGSTTKIGTPPSGVVVHRAPIVGGDAASRSKINRRKSGKTAITDQPRKPEPATKAVPSRVEVRKKKKTKKEEAPRKQIIRVESPLPSQEEVLLCGTPENDQIAIVEESSSSSDDVDMEVPTKSEEIIPDSPIEVLYEDSETEDDMDLIIDEGDDEEEEAKKEPPKEGTSNDGMEALIQLPNLSNLKVTDTDVVHEQTPTIIPVPEATKKHQDCPCILTPLKPHQIEFLEFAQKLSDSGARGGALLDDMGLGKTLQLMSLFAKRCEELLSTRGNGVDPRELCMLVVCPKNAAGEWVNETLKHSTNLTPCRATSKALQYRTAARSRCEIVIITYDEIVIQYKDYQRALALQHKESRNMGPLFAQASSGKSLECNGVMIMANNSNPIPRHSVFGKRWGMIALDESHTVRNPQTERWTAVGALIGLSDWRWICTGTIIQNNVSDALTALTFIGACPPGLLPESDTGTSRRKVSDETLFVEVKKALNLIGIRREIYDLPKCHKFTYASPFMSEQELELYKTVFSMLESVVRDCQFAQEKGRRKSLRQSALEVLTRLKQVCTLPKLAIEKIQRYLKENNQPPLPEHLTTGDWMSSSCTKMILFERFFKEKVVPGDKVLVFSNSLGVLDQCALKLKDLSLQHVRIDGSSSIEERDNAKNAFNNNPLIRVILISTKAGNTSLNLQAANRVLIYEDSLNPQTDRQAFGRAHRINQKREVTVTRLLISGSIEENISSRCQSKLTISECVLEQGKSIENAYAAFVNIKESLLKIPQQSSITGISATLGKCKLTELHTVGSNNPPVLLSTTLQSDRVNDLERRRAEHQEYLRLVHKKHGDTLDEEKRYHSVKRGNDNIRCLLGKRKFMCPPLPESCDSDLPLAKKPKLFHSEVLFGSLERFDSLHTNVGYDELENALVASEVLLAGTNLYTTELSVAGELQRLGGTLSEGGDFSQLVNQRNRLRLHTNPLAALEEAFDYVLTNFTGPCANMKIAADDLSRKTQLKEQVLSERAEEFSKNPAGMQRAREYLDGELASIRSMRSEIVRLWNLIPTIRVALHVRKLKDDLPLTRVNDQLRAPILDNYMFDHSCVRSLEAHSIVLSHPEVNFSWLCGQRSVKGMSKALIRTAPVMDLHSMLEGMKTCGFSPKHANSTAVSFLVAKMGLCILGQENRHAGGYQFSNVFSAGPNRDSMYNYFMWYWGPEHGHHERALQIETVSHHGDNSLSMDRLRDIIVNAGRYGNQSGQPSPKGKLHLVVPQHLQLENPTCMDSEWDLVVTRS